jgi:hypothetical protein
VLHQDGDTKGGVVNRIDIETKLNESRTWLLEHVKNLPKHDLHEPLTPSEHDPENKWSPLDHVSHLALIEGDFQQMIRRFLSGEKNPVGLLEADDGQKRTREQIMAIVNASTEKFQREHHHDSLSQVVALTAKARAATLMLLSELSDEQLEQVLPGAPWADGTIGGVLGANADHARMHWKWLVEAGLNNEA